MRARRKKEEGKQGTLTMALHWTLLPLIRAQVLPPDCSPASATRPLVTALEVDGEQQNARKLC